MTTLAIAAPIRRRRPAAARIAPAVPSPVVLHEPIAAIFPLKSEWEPDREIFEDLGPQEFRRVAVMTAATFDAMPSDRRPEQVSRQGDLILTLGLAPRWEVPAVCERPQPKPIVAEWDGAEIRRTWKGPAPRNCRLCASCHARPVEGWGHGGEILYGCSVCPDDATYARLVQIEREAKTRSEELPEEAEEDFEPVGFDNDTAFALLALYSQNAADPPCAVLSR
jgi:hypothetical protein